MKINTITLKILLCILIITGIQSGMLFAANDPTNRATFSPWNNGGSIEDVTITVPGPIVGSTTWKFTKNGAGQQWQGWEGNYNGIFNANPGECWTISGYYKTKSPAGLTQLTMGGFYKPDWSAPYNTTVIDYNATIIPDGNWHFFYCTIKANETITNGIIADGPSWNYSNKTGTLYINGLQWTKTNYVVPYSYLTNSYNQVTPWNNGGSWADVTTLTPGPVPSSKTWKFTKTGTGSQWQGWEGNYSGIFSASPGDTWTVAGYYRTTNPAGLTQLSAGLIYKPDWSGPYSTTILDSNLTIQADGRWHYFYCTMRANETITNGIIADGPSWHYSSSSGILYINGLQWIKSRDTEIPCKRPRYNSELQMPFELYLGDFNNDSVQEFAQMAGNHIYFYGADFAQTPITEAVLDTMPKRGFVGDFWGKGYDVLIAIGADNSSMLVDSCSYSGVTINNANGADLNSDIIIGDFNGDKKDEIMLYTPGTGAINFYSVITTNGAHNGGNDYIVMPNYNPGNLVASELLNCRVRAGDFDGNGRDDLIFITPGRNIRYYASVNYNGQQTFWWAFTTGGNYINSYEEISTARLRNSTQDDIIAHNDVTGEIRFATAYDGAVRWYGSNGDGTTGQIQVAPNSQLFWGFLKKIENEAGGHIRSDALVYDRASRMFTRSDARQGNLYYWVHTQNATKRIDFRCEIARRGIPIKNQNPRGTCAPHSLTFLYEYQYTSMFGAGSGYNSLSEEYLNYWAQYESVHGSSFGDGGSMWEEDLKAYKLHGIIPFADAPYLGANWTYAAVSAECATQDKILKGLSIRDKHNFNARIFACSYNADYAAMDQGGYYTKDPYKVSTDPAITDNNLAPLTAAEFNTIIDYLNNNIPVAHGGGHCRPIVGYEIDPNAAGGGYFILKNSYGIAHGDLGFDKEPFDKFKNPAKYPNEAPFGYAVIFP